LIDLIKEIYEGTGNSKEKLLRLYGKDLSYKSASAYLAGIKLHLETVKKLENNFEAFDEEIDDEIDKEIDSNKTESDFGKEITFNKDRSQTVKQDVYLTPEESADPSKIMQKMGFDPLLWEVVSCKIISGSWDVSMKMVNTKIIGKKLIRKSSPLTKTNRRYSISLTVRPLGGNITFPQILSAFKELEPSDLIDYDYNEIENQNGSFLFELPIMDFHLGKFSWSGETGKNDYNLKTAEKLWKKTVDDLIFKASKFSPIEKILFPIGQDYFHFDTPKVTTTAGTQLDSGTRWEKMFTKGIDLLVWSVEKLRKIAPVEILWVPGNHDQMLSYAATVGLAQRYSNINGVNVDLSAEPRKYRLYGINLIGYSHGEKEGKRLEGLMQIEAPEFWGKSIFREFHMGHLHTELSEPSNGIIFRRISTITATDSWHVEHGFVGSVRKAQAFIWDKERGLQAILNSNVIENQVDKP
jgi:hypothetical protein